MKSSSPRQIAILIALIASVISVGAGISILFFEYPNYLVSSLFVGLLVFFLVYLLVFYSLNNFIFQKIKPIYKTIHNISIPEEQLRREIEEKDVVQDVQDDVLKWAKRKTREIAQLKQLEKYRREFLGNVSHELKTPIFNIQGYILTLLDGGLDDPAINNSYLERAEKSVNRLISIVNDLESISRLESGELKLEMRKLNIVKMFYDSFEEHEMLAKERDIKLKFSKSVDKSVYVIGDKQRIMEVINNLIVNSIKYGKMSGTTKVDMHDMEENILIEVSDDGIGISDKDLPRIFERFFRTDKSRSREMGGTGLGLSIVKHIIEAHNQTINVSSILNEGTSFAFTMRKA
jgi:two-component system phosphate regulon sensor histidine kinase PhoR